MAKTYSSSSKWNLLSVLAGAAAGYAAVSYRSRRTLIAKCNAMIEDFESRTISALSHMVNAKDDVTHQHVHRVSIYARGLGRALGCGPNELRALEAGALLHDIGKVGVPDNILGKRGKLTPQEFEKMKHHVLLGSHVLRAVGFTFPLEPVVRYHHERWDGTGYPDGLSGTEIPLVARILAVVDFFDAVREDRPYRKAMTTAEALSLIREGRGSHFDPAVVDTFIENLPRFTEEIDASRNKEEDPPDAEEVLSESARQCPPDAGYANAEAPP